MKYCTTCNTLIKNPILYKEMYIDLDDFYDSLEDLNYGNISKEYFCSMDCLEKHYKYCKKFTSRFYSGKKLIKII